MFLKKDNCCNYTKTKSKFTYVLTLLKMSQNNDLKTNNIF